MGGVGEEEVREDGESESWWSGGEEEVGREGGCVVYFDQETT